MALPESTGAYERSAIEKGKKEVPGQLAGDFFFAFFNSAALIRTGAFR